MGGHEHLSDGGQQTLPRRGISSHRVLAEGDTNSRAGATLDRHHFGDARRRQAAHYRRRASGYESPVSPPVSLVSAAGFASFVK